MGEGKRETEVAARARGAGMEGGKRVEKGETGREQDGTRGAKRLWK